MPRTDASRSFTDDPFRFVGDHPAADFVNTVNWESRGLDRDRFSDYSRVVGWAEEAGLISRRKAAGLRRAARSRRREAGKAYKKSLFLREALHRVFSALALETVHRTSGLRAIADFNALLSAALPKLRVGEASKLSPKNALLGWTWDSSSSKLDSVFSPVLWSAAQLLTSPDAARVRLCEGTDCGWVYVDRSRNGLRRWCEMETCGTVEKSRRRAARNKRAVRRARAIPK